MIYRFASCLFAVGLVACGNDTDAAPVNYGDMLVTLGEHVVLPEHREFVTYADGLVSALQALAKSPSEQRLAAAQAAWRACRKAYRLLDAVQYVPDVNLRIAERIDVWPANGAGIEAIVMGDGAVDDKAVANAGGKKKGFLGLEYLLFSDPAGSGPAPVLLDDDFQARRTALALSMAHELASSARELDNAWELEGDGYITEFETPSLSARRYLSEVDALNDLMGGGNFALETIVGQRLALPLGRKNGGTPKPALDPTLRSDNSVTDMQSSFAGFLAVYSLPAFNLQVNQRSAALVQRVQSEIGLSEAALAAIPAPFASAVVAHTSLVQAAYDTTQALKTTWNVDVTSALGASYRPTDDDGD